jgi:DNA end-binding protein Ku
MPSTVWKGQLTFGLVSLPVRLYRAARKERVRFHYVHQPPGPAEAREEEEERSERAPELAAKAKHFQSEQDDPFEAPVSRVKQELAAESGEEPVSRAQLQRGYEVAPDQYVVFKNEELRKLRLPTSSEMSILRSVHLKEIDPVYFETSYYVVPDKGGERPYALLFTALKKTDYAALAKLAMHGREHIVVIRPGGKGLLAHTMYYTDEIRAENEYLASEEDVKPKELELATTFVKAIAGPFEPDEFKDSYREDVNKLIAGKLERRQVAATAAKSSPKVAPVIDIIEALKKSLQTTKKPAETAGKPSRAEKPRRRRA